MPSGREGNLLGYLWRAATTPWEGWVSGSLSSLGIPSVAGADTNAKLQDRGRMRLASLPVVNIVSAKHCVAGPQRVTLTRGTLFFPESPGALRKLMKIFAELLPKYFP